MMLLVLVNIDFIKINIIIDPLTCEPYISNNPNPSPLPQI